MAALGCLLTAMVTPFDSGGAVDYDQSGRLAISLLESGSDGVVVAGTTGESSTLSREEKLRLFGEVKSVVGTRGVVVAGTGSNSTKDSWELTREAEKIGVDACLLVVPCYNRPTQEGLIEHFRTVADGTSLPCILYNVPSRTGTNMAAATVVELSRIQNVVGVKEASGSLGQIGEIIQGTRDGFLVYSGNDSDTLPVLALGGHGVVSVVSHLVGIQMRRMMEAFFEGRTAAAAAMHHSLIPLMDAMFVVPNPVPVKWALNYLGFAVGRPRLPLVEPDERSAGLIRAALQGYSIDLSLCGRTA